jgi:hypothetical protein
MGMLIQKDIKTFENGGATINRKLFFKELKNALVIGNISPEKNDECVNYILSELKIFKEGAVDKSLINYDSLSIALGIGWGGYILNQLELIPYEGYKTKVSNYEIIRGVEYVLSSSIGRSIGTSVCYDIIGLIDNFENLGVDLDINILLNEFKNNLMKESVPIKDLEEASNYIEAAEKKLHEDAQKRYIEERAVH